MNIQNIIINIISVSLIIIGLILVMGSLIEKINTRKENRINKKTVEKTVGPDDDTYEDGYYEGQMG